ncbi:MAG: cell wall hydrolase [Caulobacteraceae bacterium]
MPAAAALRLKAGEDRARATNCLALAIYYEARGEVRTGQQAVAQVVLNRVRDPIYPNTICGVVFQGSERSTGCQFSFTCDGSMDRPPRGPAWGLANHLAEQALNGFVLSELGGATNYHNHTVAPVWSEFLTRSAEIGGHIFYTADLALRSRYHGGEPLIGKAILAELNVGQPGLPQPSPADAPSSDAAPDEPIVLAAAPQVEPASTGPQKVAIAHDSIDQVASADMNAIASIKPKIEWFAGRRSSVLKTAGGNTP